MSDRKGRKPETISVHALFSPDGGCENAEARFEPRELIRAADVIMGVDVMTRHTFVVYGREFLKAAAQSTNPPIAGVIYIELDEGTESDDLERLLALVESVRGKHDYNGFDDRNRRRPT